MTCWTISRTKSYGSRNLKGKAGAREVLVVGNGGVREKHRPCPLPSVQRYGNEPESGWSTEPFETDAAEV